MMKSNVLPTAWVVAIALLFANYSAETKISQPPAGNTGGPPTQKTCAQCHSGSALQNATSTLDFTFSESGNTVAASAFNYVPGKTYSVSFVPSVVSKRYGFQMSAVNSAGQNAGSFAVTDNQNTSLLTVPLNFIGHKYASGFKNWNFDWNAPATDVGNITFHYTFVSSDSSNSDNNDTVFAGTTIVAPVPSGLFGLDENLEVSIFPNPALDILCVQSKVNEEVELRMFSLSGEELETRNGNSSYTISTDNYAPGVYLLELKSAGKSSVRKVLLEGNR